MAEGTTISDVFMVIIFFVVPAAAIIVNGAEIWILTRRRRRITNNEKILLSLSIADLMVGTTFVIFQGVESHIDKDWLKRTSGSFLWFSIMTSCFHILYMTADRCIAVVVPFKHRIWVTASRTKRCIIAIWLSSVAIMGVLISKATVEITRTVLGYMINSTVIVMTLAYGLIIYKVVIQRRRLQRANDHQQSNAVTANRRDRNLVIMCVMIAVTFAAFTLPFSIKTVAHQKEDFLERIAVVFNSLTNPFIYFFWRYLDKRITKSRHSTVEMVNTSQKS